MSTQSALPVQPQPNTINNLAADLKPAGQEAAKVKPCCVCKDEKSKRDECMLFSNSSSPEEACKTTIERYRDCMRGFGFELH